MIIQNNRTSLRTRIFLLSLTVIATLSLTACINIKVRTGSRPAVSALDQLIVGESTANQVEQTLGLPGGKGQSQLPFQDTMTDLWTYYYEEGTMQDDRRTFLFVFLNEGVFDGYMWFGSLPDAEAP
jgi:hypothetical protein